MHNRWSYTKPRFSYILNHALETVKRDMTPRPRKVSDEQIFRAAHRVMERFGPTQWTLAEVAAEAGLTAGAIVQRFGSKRDLQLALMQGLEDLPRETFARLRAEHSSPLATLHAYADCVAAMGESPGGLAHHLGYLQLDLTDPDFHRHLTKYSAATSAEIRALLDEAVAARELEPVDTRALARVIEAILTGSLVAWSIYQEGSARAWLDADLDVVLRPYRSQQYMDDSTKP
jgi:AcrR family transcriptional regulator